MTKLPIALDDLASAFSVHVETLRSSIKRRVLELEATDRNLLRISARDAVAVWFVAQGAAQGAHKGRCLPRILAMVKAGLEDHDANPEERPYLVADTLSGCSRLFFTNGSPLVEKSGEVRIFDLIAIEAIYQAVFEKVASEVQPLNPRLAENPAAVKACNRLNSATLADRLRGAVLN